MTYASLSLMSFEDLLATIDRYAWGVWRLPASVTREDWAQEARLAAWSLTLSGQVSAEFSAVLRATSAAIRHHRLDAISHAFACPIEDMADGDRDEFAIVLSAAAEVIAHETFFAVRRKKRNRNGVSSCRFRKPGAVPCES